MVQKIEHHVMPASQVLSSLTTGRAVVNLSNMKAALLERTRIVYSETAFAELVLWPVPRPVAGSVHPYKYRLAFVVRGACVLRYDNEAGKGDHRHFNGEESAYHFTTPDQLIAAFKGDIARWSHEDRNP